MADGMFFNVNGKTHSLRLRVVDQCADDIAVWEALVDGGKSFFFEFAENAEIWTLFGEAVTRYMEYRGTSEIIRTDWRARA